MLQDPRTARISRRRLAMRAATHLLVTIVAVVGLWGASHADDLGLSSPATSSTASPVVAVGPQVVDTAVGAPADTTTVIGVITCILGILCGVALAALLYFALRLRLVLFQCLRALPAPMTSYSAFDHRARRRFGLLELNLLRI